MQSKNSRLQITHQENLQILKLYKTSWIYVPWQVEWLLNSSLSQLLDIVSYRNLSWTPASWVLFFPIILLINSLWFKYDSTSTASKFIPLDFFNCQTVISSCLFWYSTNLFFSLFLFSTWWHHQIYISSLEFLADLHTLTSIISLLDNCTWIFSQYVYVQRRILDSHLPPNLPLL